MSNDRLVPFENLISSSSIQLEFKSLKKWYLKLFTIFFLSNVFLFGFEIVSLMLFLDSYLDVKDECKEYYISYSLNVLGFIFIIMITAFVNLTMRWISSSSIKYFRYYLILITFHVISKTFQFIYYLNYVKEKHLNKENNNCSQIILFEKCESLFIVYLFLILLLFLLGLKMKIHCCRLNYLVKLIDEHRIVFQMDDENYRDENYN